ncbi:hypothetical protein HPY28_19335 [Brevibacillus sp. HB1.2]|uniref:hypothetical protein n=1 Tax=Brevibacillus sp. HB1.2 TaxID=2738807 RepID=UPI0015777443|nr:hypothetical protein [Brevibacillus sp. HB1.2]NTU22479.1 hypothetical protein [Brevibacillus sp. HB1.2]
MFKSTNKRILERPISTFPLVPDGVYNGQLESVEIKELESSFHPNGKRTAVNFKINIKLPDDEVETLYVSPTYTWSMKGKLIKQLDDLEALPEPGESLDLDRLEGMNVTVYVENTEKDGQTYSNIVKMTKRKPAEVPRPPMPRKRANKPVEVDIDSFFGDDDI